MQLVKIPGTALVRDTTTRALINQDKNGLNDYLNKRKIMEAQRSEINTLKTEITNIKDDMHEIKSLLLTLLEKGTHG